jgi:CRISPR system Cascade subunit CasD
VTHFLGFTLAAPLASFGSIAIGERRSTWDRPAKSAVLGLIAGSLGLTRDQEEAHRALAGDYLYAVRVEDLDVRKPLQAMTDFHTVQTAPSVRGRVFATRREELAADKLGTILTRREYRTDCLFTVVVWQIREDARWSLEELAAALLAPSFIPYLGRKTCPLMLPMAPRIVNEAEPISAFVAYDMGEAEARIVFRKSRRLNGEPRLVALDAAGRTFSTRGRLEKRRDVIRHRGRWQFDLREEVVIPLRRDSDE